MMKDYLLQKLNKKYLQKLPIALKNIDQLLRKNVAHTFWIYGSVLFLTLSVCLFLAISSLQNTPLLSPILNSLTTVKPRAQTSKQHEIFGFAPYWTFNKLDNVDYTTLTTFAYFGIEVNSDGSLETQGPGYDTFMSDKATQVFNKAHSFGTRVVLTVTQMDNDTIDAFLNDSSAQNAAVANIASLIKQRGIDGVNVDFEYVGNPGSSERDQFTSFITSLSGAMHQQVPNSHVTISVYASSAKSPKLYDLANLAPHLDSVFMMAYDFYTTSSESVMPTAPLYGAKKGKYSYDISSAVDDFLKVMPADKLILGVPYYGYSYLTYSPQPYSQTRPAYSWRGSPTAQTIAYFRENVTPEKTGWDSDAEVGWKAYYDADTDTWRMIFLEDEKSLGIKYEYAKSKNLQGVGIWALGFDNGTSNYWALLKDKFGVKLADARDFEQVK